MKSSIAVITAAFVLGVAPMSSAFAAERPVRYMSIQPYEAVEAYGGIREVEPQSRFGCPMSSAAEGNANQQTRPVMQYGQTSGGTRC